MKIKQTRRTVVIGSILTVALVAGVAFAISRKANQNSSSTSDTVAGPNTPNTINYDGPTETDKQETETHKDDLVQQTKDTTPSTPETTVKSVTPTLVNAFYSTARSQVTVSGFVSGVIEDGGVCTVSLTKGGDVVTKTSTGTANVSQTDCPPFNINRTEFASSGTWSVTLSYKSATVSGNSKSQNVEVP